MLELHYPTRGFKRGITQKFGGNANPSYQSDGLIGHTGVDSVTFYDDVIHLSQNGKVYKIINRDNKDLSRFRAIFQLVNGENGYTDCTEVCYGHCNKINCSLGELSTGTPIATEGNSGMVYVGGHMVTKDEKEKGSKAGTHIHFQIRPVMRTNQYDACKNYLSSQEEISVPHKDGLGNYYEIPLYQNGYNGCIDPEPFFSGMFAGDVEIISKEITLLQKIVGALKRYLNEIIK